jgi:dienelactone hydrolase
MILKKPSTLMAIFFIGVSVVMICIYPNISDAQVVRIEVLPLRTMTLTDQQFLTGVKEGKPTLIAGELRIPRPGSDRLPAIILVHGSGGIGANINGWSQELNKIGVATFILDGFTGRGITGTVINQGQLSRLTMINDAYRVLELLARHPRIDPSRIGIMGFSRGGQVALYASLKRFKRMHGPSDVEFAVYLALYPPCLTTYIDDGEVSDKPIRLFHGKADDYVPVAPCRAYVERLQKAGKDVQLTEYPDAHHSFDSFDFPASFFIQQAQTTRRCKTEEKPVGQIINSQTGQPFSYDDPCVERGTTVGYNAQAHSETLKAVKEVLTVTFKLK